MKPLMKLLLLVIGFISFWGCATIRNVTEVKLDIIDEQGHAIPYATVWGYLLPRANPLAIDAEDLWRITTRYQSSFELITDNAGNRPIAHLKVMPMADAVGHTHFQINYQYEEGSAAKTPDTMYVGYTVLKRGYFPARINFTLLSESTVSGKLVLKRDPKQDVASQEYQLNFERLRYEMSNPKLNVEISKKNDERMLSLKTQLDAAAQQALAAGDKQAAARIYARMQYLPAIRFINEIPAGFTQAEPSSEQAMAYLDKAYSLDSANSHIAAEYLFNQGAVK